MRGKKCMVYTYFESQKLSHPMSLVPNRTSRALGKTLAGKKMPAGTRLGTAALSQMKTVRGFYRIRVIVNIPN
jgi:hypothetical protein